MKLSIRSLRASLRWLATYPRYDVARTRKEACRISYQRGYQAGYRSAIRQQGRSPADREAHNLEVGGSIPPPATTFDPIAVIERLGFGDNS